MESGMGIKSYRDLIAWQKAMDLVEQIYKSSRQFPRDETYGLTSQLRRAAVSIPSNIAEGQGRRTDREFANFVSIANGSLYEAETQLLIARRLQYLDENQLRLLMDLSSEVGKLLHGLARALEK